MKRNLFLILIAFLVIIGTVKADSINFTSPTPANGTINNTGTIFINTTSVCSNNCTSWLTYGLVGHWKLNEANGTIAEDISAYRNNGTLVNMNLGLNNCTGNCSGWNSSGRFGNGVSFDGVDDYINISSVSPSTSITQEGWFNFSQLALGNGNKFLFSNLYQHNANNFIYINSPGAHYFDAGITSTGVWYHIALVVDNTSNVSNSTLYVNTVPISIFLQGADLVFPNVQYIGNPLASFNGTIDEIKVYNRTLSKEEINASYNAGINRLSANITAIPLGSFNTSACIQNNTGNTSCDTRYWTIENPYSVSGYVTNNYGYVVSGVLVTASDRSSTTNATGYYILNTLLNGTNNLSFSKSGYSTGALSVNISGVNLTNQNIVLNISDVSLDYTTSTCKSTLGWGEVGSALIIVFIIAVAGGLAIGFLTGSLKLDNFPIEEFVLSLVAIVIIGSIGVAIINPIIIIVGCP